MHIFRYILKCWFTLFYDKYFRPGRIKCCVYFVLYTPFSSMHCGNQVLSCVNNVHVESHLMDGDLATLICTSCVFVHVVCTIETIVIFFVN
jgi:hypothetical protein